MPGAIMLPAEGVGGFCVNQAFKNAVESIEPGVHQFIPFDVYNKDGTRYPDTFYTFHVYTLVDAINFETGGIKKRPGYHYDKGNPDDFRYAPGRLDLSKAETEYRSVFKDRITGRAAWRDKRMPYPYIFASDALVERLKAAKLEGWEAEFYFKEV
ncbi:MAG: DUF1629 domain-containing protein [Myxococcota bacterium]